jgi:hypothetical protein
MGTVPLFITDAVSSDRGGPQARRTRTKSTNLSYCVWIFLIGQLGMAFPEAHNSVYVLMQHAKCKPFSPAKCLRYAMVVGPSGSRPQQLPCRACRKLHGPVAVVLPENNLFIEGKHL